jgi:hypothetical protein
MKFIDLVVAPTAHAIVVICPNARAVGLAS